MEGLGSEEDTQRRDNNPCTTTGGKFFNIFTDICVFSQIQNWEKVFCVREQVITDLRFVVLEEVFMSDLKKKKNVKFRENYCIICKTTQNTINKCLLWFS